MNELALIPAIYFLCVMSYDLGVTVAPTIMPSLVGFGVSTGIVIWANWRYNAILAKLDKIEKVAAELKSVVEKNRIFAAADKHDGA
jgi:hypothetical protein